MGALRWVMGLVLGGRMSPHFRRTVSTRGQPKNFVRISLVLLTVPACNRWFGITEPRIIFKPPSNVRQGLINGVGVRQTGFMLQIWSMTNTWDLMLISYSKHDKIPGLLRNTFWYYHFALEFWFKTISVIKKQHNSCSCVITKISMTNTWERILLFYCKHEKWPRSTSQHISEL